MISLALSLALVAPPSHAPTRVDVNIEPLVANGAPEDPAQERKLATEVGDAIRLELGNALRDRGVSVHEAETEATVSVTLDWKVYLDSHYIVTIEVDREGLTQPVTSVVECKLCEAAQVAAKVAEQAEAIAEHLEVEGSSEPGPEGTGPGPHGTGNGEEDTHEPTPLVPPPKVVGPLGYGGIWLGAAGLGGVIAGAVLLAQGQETRLDSEPRYQLVDDRGPAGAVALGVGGAAMVAGAVLIAVDQTVGRRNRKRRAEQARRQVLPAVSPRSVGLSAIVKF